MSNVHQRTKPPDQGNQSTTSANTSCASRDHPNKAKATTDQGDQSATSAKAQSASRDHQDRDAVSTNLARTSIGPADATGDDERRPDAPTEPPDQPEGTKEQGGELRVEAAESESRESSRWCTEGAGDVDDDGEGPGEPHERFVTLHEAARDPAHVQVEPGGEAQVERNGSVTLESADAQVDAEVVGMRPDAQDERESAEARRNASIEGQSGSASIRARSRLSKKTIGPPPPMTTTYLKIPQIHLHHLTALGTQRTSPRASISRGRETQHRASTTHNLRNASERVNERSNAEKEPQSFELEGEGEGGTSIEPILTSDEADASVTSESLEDARDVPKNQPNASDNAWSKGEEKPHVEEPRPTRRRP
ncbi:hypothetical protein OG21DRAFT_1490356 [Imleria badia]|nr:hypothetical protein OG21DRAFT_1490356 [Imleria badia]